MSAGPPAAVGPAPAFTPPLVERARMANGIELFVVPRRRLPIFDLQLLVRGGALLDSAAQAGRASLTAELLDEGTALRSALEISAELELLGAALDLRSGWDACFFALHGLTPRLPQLLDLLADIALGPTFPPKEFRRKHEERLHTLLQERDEPRLVATKALQRAIFGTQHPYGQPLNGTVASIQALSRADMIAYYTTACGPHTASFLVAGDVDPESMLALLEQCFAGWASPAAAEPVLPSAGGGERAIHLIDRPGAPQSEVRIGHVGVPRGTPDYFPLLVMNTILGGSFKSRLNMRLREEKGFTYGASSSFSCRRQSGVFSGSTAVITEATAETVSIFVEEVERMRTDQVTAEELDRARNYLALGFMRNFETTGAIAAHLIDVALYGLGEEYLREYPERVAAVTRDEVATAAGRYLHPDQLSIVVVGDVAQVRSHLDRLQLGEVREWDAA